MSAKTIFRTAYLWRNKDINKMFGAREKKTKEQKKNVLDFRDFTFVR